MASTNVIIGDVTYTVTNGGTYGNGSSTHLNEVAHTLEKLAERGYMQELNTGNTLTNVTVITVNSLNDPSLPFFDNNRIRAGAYTEFTRGLDGKVNSATIYVAVDGIATLSVTNQLNAPYYIPTNLATVLANDIGDVTLRTNPTQTIYSPTKTYIDIGNNPATDVYNRGSIAVENMERRLQYSGDPANVKSALRPESGEGDFTTNGPLHNITVSDDLINNGNVMENITESMGGAGYAVQDGQVLDLDTALDWLVELGVADGFETPEEILEILAELEAGESRGSPLILDLDGDGIEATSLSTSNAFFDLTNDGYAERTGWVGVDDGLLSVDLNGDGIIRGSSELFGNKTTDGFTIAKQYDTNGDGALSAEDAVWTDLKIWRDLDQNGVSTTNELFKLSDYGITSINLNATEVSGSINGNLVTHASSYTYNNGSGSATRDIKDVWFSYDAAITRYDQAFKFDSRVAYLPTAKGYGTLADLHIAMSLNNSGSGNLLSLVSNLNAKTFAQLFDSTSTLKNDIRTILFKWAAVDAVSAGSRGSFVDAQELAFLEKLSGNPFLQRGIYSNPQGSEAGNDITEAFQHAFNFFYARIVSQVAGKELFDGTWHYDLVNDQFVGITGLSQTALNSLQAEAQALANDSLRTVFWSNVLRVIQYSIGTENLSVSEYNSLNAAIEGSSASLDINVLLTGLEYVRPSGVNEDGTSGADVINGSSGDDDLGGGYGNDTLNGGAGNDKLYGEGDADVLNGGTGGDYLWGGFGSDTYNYSIGDGQDTIREEGISSGDLADKIVFGTGITISNLTLTRVGNTDLVIDISGTTAGKIIIENQFNYNAGGGSVETLQFAGGSTYSLTGQAWTMHGTSGNDTLYGVSSGGLTTDSIYGDGGNDTIDGGAGNDTLYGGDGYDYIKGGAGDDVIYGDNGDDKLYGEADNDTLYGGAGNDTLDGAAGNDIYWYVSGIDTVTDSSGTDTLKLDAVWNGITPQYLRIGNDLQLFFDANNSVTIKNHWAAGGYVETLLYANATSVNLTTVSYVAQGTSGNDTLTGNASANTMYGLSGNDTMNGGDGNDVMYGGDGTDTMQGQNGNDNVYGEAGNDTIYGNAGNDYLDGGAGNDYMQGGTDNDTYFYSSGIDQIYDSSGTDILKITAGYDLSDALLVRRIDTVTNAYDLRVEFSPTNYVWIDDYFNGTASAVETLQFADLTSVTLNTLSYTVYGSSAGETIAGVSTGGLTNDIMYGMGGNDTLNGDAGDDVMYGGAGNDSLYGGAGNDTYVYESGLDTFSDLNTSTDKIIMLGSTTVDGISFSSTGTSDTKITINAGVDEITVKNLRSTSQYHIETIEFSDGFKTTLPNYASWVNGTSGNDTQTGTASSDTILGKAGNDIIDGAGGNDYLHGGAGNDTVKGGAGDDLVHGGIGDDLIYGQDGLDTLYGGSGADTFFFEAASAYNNIDVVKDFSLADGDKLNLANLLTSYNPLTHAIEDFVKMTDNSGNTFVSVDRDGAGTTYGFQQIATIQGMTGLTDEAALKAAGTLITA